MKNKEKFAKEIVEVAMNGSLIAVDKNNIPRDCDGFDCEKCILRTGAGLCGEKLREWAEAEYVEPKSLRKKKRLF